jgi:hypothetical protein
MQPSGLARAEYHDAVLAETPCQFPDWPGVAEDQEVRLGPASQASGGRHGRAAARCLGEAGLHSVVPALRHDPGERIVGGDEHGFACAVGCEDAVHCGRAAADADLDAAGIVAGAAVSDQRAWRDRARGGLSWVGLDVDHRVIADVPSIYLPTGLWSTINTPERATVPAISAGYGDWLGATRVLGRSTTLIPSPLAVFSVICFGTSNRLKKPGRAGCPRVLDYEPSSMQFFTLVLST